MGQLLVASWIPTRYEAFCPTPTSGTAAGYKNMKLQRGTGSAAPRRLHHSCNHPASFALVSSGGIRDTDKLAHLLLCSCCVSNKQLE